MKSNINMISEKRGFFSLRRKVKLILKWNIFGQILEEKPPIMSHLSHKSWATVSAFSVLHSWFPSYFPSSLVRWWLSSPVKLLSLIHHLTFSEMCICAFSFTHTMLRKKFSFLLFSISMECFCNRIRFFSYLCLLYVLWGTEHLFLGLRKMHSTSGAYVWKYAFLLQVFVSRPLWQNKFKRFVLPGAPQLYRFGIESFFLMAYDYRHGFR